MRGATDLSQAAGIDPFVYVVLGAFVRNTQELLGFRNCQHGQRQQIVHQSQQRRRGPSLCQMFMPVKKTRNRLQRPNRLFRPSRP